MLEGEPGHQDAMLRTEYAVKTLTDAGVEVEKLASDTANWKRGQAEQSKYNGHGVSFSVHEDRPVPDVKGLSALQTF